jgi:hypothetical protein
MSQLEGYQLLLEDLATPRTTLVSIGQTLLKSVKETQTRIDSIWVQLTNKLVERTQRLDKVEQQLRQAYEENERLKQSIIIRDQYIQELLRVPVYSITE